MAKEVKGKCCRCRHVALISEWPTKPVPRKGSITMTQSVCPRCGCESYYDMTPEVAWCWASGLIEFGNAMPPDQVDGSGAIEIARGPKYALRGRVGALARHGRGESKGQLLVPGVPERTDQKDKADALAEWLAWCGMRKNKDGVTFSTMTAVA